MPIEVDAYYQLTKFQLTEFQLIEFQLTEFQLTEFQRVLRIAFSFDVVE